jgi:rubrerythrin
MPTTFAFAEKPVMSLVRDAIVSWHPNLLVADVRVGVLMANSPDGPAIKHGGYPALATMKVIGHKDRLSKKYEAELTIDAMDWSDLPEECRMALLDHELSHIDLVPLSPAKKKLAEERGKPWWKIDYHERPRLRSVKGDWNAGDGFKAACARHGKNAIEFRNLNECFALAKEAQSKGWVHRCADCGIEYTGGEKCPACVSTKTLKS